MKKFIIILAVCATAVAFASCNKDEEGGKCKCTYKLLGVETTVHQDLSGTVLTCSDVQTSLKNKVGVDVTCTPEN